MPCYQASRNVGAAGKENCGMTTTFFSWVLLLRRLSLHMCVCQSVAMRSLISSYFRAHSRWKSLVLDQCAVGLWGAFTHTHTHTDYLLLSLDGVHWSHVITGNVATATGGERTSIPPVPFTEREREREKKQKSTLIHFISYDLCCHWTHQSTALVWFASFNAVHVENI